MSRVLLDTSTLIWAIEQRETKTLLGLKTKKLLETAAAVYVSPISVVEIRIKTMLGKLVSQPDLLEDIRKSGLELLDFSAEQAEKIQDFPALTRHDPFDRMLLAQARAENMLFVTADTALLKLGLDFVLDARQ